MAVAVDTGRVASYCGILESDVQTLKTQPTPDLVTDFLRTILTKAQEHESLKSKCVRLDVELENAVRGSEAKIRTSKANADRALEEVKSLREKLDKEGELYFI